MRNSSLLWIMEEKVPGTTIIGSSLTICHLPTIFLAIEMPIEHFPMGWCSLVCKGLHHMLDLLRQVRGIFWVISKDMRSHLWDGR